MNLNLKVDCYSGNYSDEWPLRFNFATHSGRTYAAVEILRAHNQKIYILRHEESDNSRTLGSIRRDFKTGG